MGDYGIGNFIKPVNAVKSKCRRNTVPFLFLYFGCINTYNNKGEKCINVQLKLPVVLTASAAAFAASIAANEPSPNNIFFFLLFFYFRNIGYNKNITEAIKIVNIYRA